MGKLYLPSPLQSWMNIRYHHSVYRGVGLDSLRQALVIAQASLEGNPPASNSQTLRSQCSPSFSVCLESFNNRLFPLELILAARLASLDPSLVYFILFYWDCLCSTCKPPKFWIFCSLLLLLTMWPHCPRSYFSSHPQMLLAWCYNRLLSLIRSRCKALS